MKGLSDKEVIEHRKKYGSNVISKKKSDTLLKLFIESLGDPIIKILLIALGIKIVFLLKDFDWYETIGIVIAIFIASFISSISEYGSSKAFQRLQAESSKIKCRVLRNSKIMEINIDEVVYQDIVALSSGDKIPADGDIIEGHITVDESSMNGETKEIEKNVGSFVYRNTVVYEGNAYMQVTAVGDTTYYGQLALELQEKQEPSPLRKRLLKLAKIISRIGYVSAFLVAFSYLFSKIVLVNNFDLVLIKDTITNLPLVIGYILHALTLSVTIIVVAVPEGLPMMITLVLSSNMKKMLKDNVLVRKLVGIETAGNLNVLFTDKTGTLTKGKLEIISIIDGDLKEYHNLIEMNDKYKNLLIDSLIYNNASSYDEVTNKIIGGNITDRALLDFIRLKKERIVKVLDNIPFTSKNKYSITIIEKDGKKYKLIKGSPEIILEQIDNYYNYLGIKQYLKNKDALAQRIKLMTSQGIRVLALSISDNVLNINSLRSTLLGIVFIKDEVRKESEMAIKLVKDAHIQTVMITGDNRETAVSIAKEVGLVTSQSDLVITSNELNKMSDDYLKEIIPRLRVVSRALPQDKSKLVNICKELDLVVGMTGDGVNDALALRKADVGFAMGSGTEVSKEASDIVILDDNFLSIVKAILYGRTIFKNIRKFIIFQLTVNLCAVSVSIIGPFMGIPVPVTVIQMLWINMVMDTLAGLAFSFEPPLLEYMGESPKKKNEHIINKYMLNEIIVTGIYSSLLCIFFLKSKWVASLFRYTITNNYLMTAFFGLFIFIGISNCFNARTHRLNILANLLKNKVFLIIILFVALVQVTLIYYGGTLFRTSDLTLPEFGIMLLLSLTVIPFDFFRKLLLKRAGKCTGV